ncbi:MAG: amidohydrolase family protein, partial [Elusimicrobiota bacterium]
GGKMFDLIIRNAKVRGQKELVDIGISGTKIRQILPKIKEKVKPQENEINAAGNLVTPTFIDPHIHLDKCLISDSTPKNISGTLKESIELTWERKKKYTVKDIVERAGKVIEWHILHGSTIIRTHIDIDTIGKLKTIEGMLVVREKYKDLVNLEIVAFPQEGIIQDAGTQELMDKAMAMGADVVGGMPHNEMIESDGRRHIDICFELAKKYNKDIDMHVDETDDPSSRTLQYLAYKTIQEKYFGRVTAGHTCALAAYDDYYAAKVIAWVKQAQINMITNPVTNLMIEGRLDKQPIRRGTTRIKELMEAGVNVSYGQDCVKDTFYPTWGQGDMLECGLVTAHAAQFTQIEQVEQLYEMITANAAKILRLKDYGIEEGKTANLNVIDAPTIQEMFRTQADRLYVIRRGKVVARTKTDSVIIKP